MNSGWRRTFQSDDRKIRLMSTCDKIHIQYDTEENHLAGVSIVIRF